MNENRIKTISLPVEGMTCASCVARVEKSLKKIDGVEEVNVNLATEKVTLTYKENEASVAQFTKAVGDAGYNLVVPTEDSITKNQQVSEKKSVQAK